MRPAPNSPSAPVLLYDGVCGVCNSSVRTILRHDRVGTLRFAALDSDFAREILARHPEAADLDSAIYIRNAGEPDEALYAKSAALLEIARYLGGWWKVTLAAFAIPPAVRDWAYTRFAAARYRIGGRYDTCPVPTDDVRSRFLDTTYG